LSEDIDQTHFLIWAKNVKEIIYKRMRKAPIIFIGRGGQTIFQNDPRAFHLLVVSSPEIRLRRIMEKYGQDLKARWGIWEFPTAFLVDQSMKIVEKWQGKIAVESLEKEIINNILAKTERKKAGSKTSPPACSNGVCY